jgi:hypothetical protein
MVRAPQTKVAAMSDDEEELEHKPFRPASGAVDERIACALEYIAAQMGEINDKLDYLTGVYEYEAEDDDKK